MVRAFLSGRSGRIAVQVAVTGVVVAAAVTYAALNKSVTLSIDGRTQTVHAITGSVEGLLAGQGVRTGPRDLVAPAPSSSIADGDTVVVRYARPLTVTVDGQKKTFWTTQLNVQQALNSLGLRSDGAALSASRSALISRSGMTMWLSTPKKVGLTVDGRRTIVSSTAPTVGALLTQRGISVAPTDRLSAVPGAPLENGQNITLVKITHKRVTRSEAVRFGVTRHKNAKMYEGETKVVRKGRAGARTVTYAVVLEDGGFGRRSVVSATLTRRPVDQVVDVGTKEKPVAASSESSGSSTPPKASGKSGSLNWAALADCESGGDPDAVNPAGYYGLYQFSTSTWASVGGSGLPSNASASEQTSRAQTLYDRGGDGAWPNCGHHLYD